MSVCKLLNTKSVPPPLTGCRPTHRQCKQCLVYTEMWRLRKNKPKCKTFGSLPPDSQQLKITRLVPALPSRTGLRTSLMSTKVSKTFFFRLSSFLAFYSLLVSLLQKPPSASTRCTHIPFHVLLNMLVSQWAICQGPCLWCTQERAEHLPCLKIRGAERAPVEQLNHWVTSWKLMSMKTRRHVRALNCCLWRLCPTFFG